MDLTPQKIAIAAEGASLAGTYYAPSGEVRASLVLHGATGVPQRFYRHFAGWAAARGIGVLTYDYRDFGESQHRPMRDSDAIFADWAVRDQAAAQRKLAEIAPDGPLWVLGHSLGGLGIPFHGYPERTEKIVTVGAGIGHFTDHPWSYRPKVLAFWFALGPLATAVAGYMPGKRLLLGADLPAGVYWQWRRWCTRRDFFNGDIGVSLPEPNYALSGPEVRICVARDDVVVPPVAVRRYADALAPAGAVYRCFTPADYGLSRLNHIEFLARDNQPVWADLLGLSVPAGG
ncbi:alpha/beta fold hydrolase [Sinirhodobacter ferrireducens]|uniref:Alpha/beta fold hydrolase n=1 Tax=Paenirhodobacter ferrireducens TaxID=1215032 RepID=A0A443L5B5_9RHOB|nr:alpha/beta fold hydrolase [Sinirhodobacter ferrireducens]RWR44354.1 alpha/beta fold hydrolase [Sinirhodobacter ferrireducens]